MNAISSSSGGVGHGGRLVVPDGSRSRAGVSEFLAPSCEAGPNKRKRRPAGTPDPDAEVVAHSPKTLMESDRFICEICNQGFQRDQNLQMHRRRHKVPWKLLKRPNLPTTKRVYICPERSCLHHDPAHALGDLVGIKKHYRRKHCTEKQWKCDKCSKRYAVQSDYKAHLKTCGTRGHCCDCGRVFSRVESFIEHQDTCNAVKRKTTQSESGSERIPAHHGTEDNRNSNESPSQSSDTTQAMSFTQSGMSDTAERSVDHVDCTKVLEEHARRIQESHPAVPASAAAAGIPAWLTDHIRRNELELLQRLPTEMELLQRLPTDHAQSSHFVTQEVRPARAHQASNGSRSKITHCSSLSAQPSEVIACPKMKMSILEPSLQLSIGPASAEVASSGLSPYPDIKPSFSNSIVLDRDAQAWKNYYAKQFAPAGVTARIGNSSRPVSVEFDAMVGQSGVIRRMERAGTDSAATSLSVFLKSALSPVESGAGLVHQSTKTVENKLNCSEMVSYYNSACGSSTSSCHENRVRSHTQESVDPAQGPRARKRGNFTNAQPEPAISLVITRKQELNLGVAETDHLFGATSVSNEAFRSQKQIAAATDHQASCDQAPANMNVAWSDQARVRRTTHEAQRELARAEILKREAREQLQFAAAEKAYADSAREVAKRQVEMSDAELAKAKQLWQHAQSELLNASSQANFSPSYCHSCKSTIQESAVPSRRSTSTSPTSWSMIAPSPTAIEQSQVGSCRSTQIFMNPGTDVLLDLEIGTKHVDQVAMDSNRFYDSGNRLSWSETVPGELWPAHGYRNKSTGMTIGDTPPPARGNRLDLVAVQVSLSPAQSDRRDQIAPKDLNFN